MKRQDFSHRIIEMFRGYFHSLFSLVRWIALMIISYFIIDYFVNSLAFISFVGAFFLGSFLDGVVQRLLPNSP